MSTPQPEAWPFHISQGEYAVGDGRGRSIATILGSCVAACLYDPIAKVGGMNHFLLPEAKGSAAPASSFGINSMELLINALIKQGALRTRLQAKVFGGGRIIAGLSDIGAQNAAFIGAFLRREGIVCTGQSLGGNQARRVIFWPEEGRARQKFLGEVGIVEQLPVVVAKSNDIEIF